MVISIFVRLYDIACGHFSCFDCQGQDFVSEIPAFDNELEVLKPSGALISVKRISTFNFSLSQSYVKYCSSLSVTRYSVCTIGPLSKNSKSLSGSA